MQKTAKILPFPSGSGLQVDRQQGGSRQTPSDLLSVVTDYIASKGSGEGRFETTMPNVHIVQSFRETMPIHNMYRPSLCVVLKGEKQILFGDSTLHYREMECLVVNLELPATGRMLGASPEAPYIGLMVDFDVAALTEVLQQMTSPPASSASPGPCVFVGRVDDALAGCILRLARLASRPEAVSVLYPAAMKELYYWLLTGPYGEEIAKLAIPETQAERVARALRILREEFAQTLSVERLAEVACMSVSSFHHHFKSMTSMTPLQYQKQLRLLEARRLMVIEDAMVADAAYSVGYESASQFSREYTRVFGAAPKRDAQNYRDLLEEADRG